MNIEDLIEFGGVWSGLGDSVQEQVQTVLDDSHTTSVNLNAITMAVERLQNLKSVEPVNEIYESLKDYIDNYDPTPYCTHCGPKSACDCGPFAEND